MPERDPNYAPYPVITDESRFGLEVSRASNELGSAVARSRRTDSSPRATIFLHGAAGSWTTWTPLLAAAEYEGAVIPNPVLIDLPGWGEGTITELGRAAVLDAACGLITELAEALGFTEWDIVGHSMGGFIALHLAAIRPANVMSVGTISATGASVIAGIAHPVRGLGTVPSFIMLWQIMRFLALFGAGAMIPLRAMRATGVLRPAVGPLFRHPFWISSTVVTALAIEVRPRTFASAVQLARGYDAPGIWGDIRCAVRATQGDHDAFSVTSDLDAIGRILPLSQRALLVDCGHFGAIERPRDVLVALGYLD
jgi:pimeloyl-ACP methyl ester carboxylesterase